MIISGYLFDDIILYAFIPGVYCIYWYSFKTILLLHYIQYVFDVILLELWINASDMDDEWRLL